jgi:exopolyphosphatase/guanosine-5'-triphosphate,3'-diphosphate pyrophosphatase
MRLGVLDVGSNTVHLLVVDAYSGARPMPAFSHKVNLKLAAQLDGTSLSGPGEKGLRGVVEEALRIAEDKGVEEIIAFATSAVREAVNGELVLRAAAGDRHRRRLARGRVGHRRGAGRDGLAAAGGRAPDPGLAQ